jgi:signal transduction histidine kinase
LHQLRKYLPILFSFLFFFKLAAEPNIDSLRSALLRSHPDTNKVNLLCSIAKLSDGDEAKNYAEQALELSEKLEFISGLAQSNALLGRSYYFREDFAPSLLHLNAALKYARAIPNYRIAGFSCLYLGYNNYQNEPAVSLEYYLQCLRYSRLAKNRLMESYAYSAIGNLYEKWEDGKGALGYFLISLKIRQEMGSKDEIVSSLIESARAYNRTGEYDKSYELVTQALNIAEKEGKDQQNLVHLYQMTGYNYADIKKDYKTALEYFLKSYNIVVSRNSFDINTINSIKPVAEMYQKLGDNGNASRYYKMYVDLMDAEKKKIDKQLVESQFLLKKENEKQKLLLKDKEIMRQKMEIQKKENMAGLFVAGMAILLLLVFFVYRDVRRKQRSIAELDKKVKERTAELGKANEQLQAEIGERQIIQEKLSQSESQLIEINKELESFTYKVSHDLKGPIASSKGLISLALTADNEEEKQQFMKLIDTSLDRLNGILLDLQELALIRQGKVLIKKVDVVHMINDMLPNFSAYENYHKIRFNIRNDLKCDFHTDEILLNSVLRNVLENSVKYSQKGTDDPAVNILLSEEKKFYKIKVSDNGIGISEEFHSRIFDVFFRANEITRGSGLGLYIVKNAMNKLKGKVELERSELKVGTTMNLFFPKEEA